MQPYFFPYLGYFSLIQYTDQWIIFDPVQYIKKGWVNRNRVLKNGGGVKYVGVTVEKTHRDTLIKDVFIKNESDALDKIIRNLDYYQNVNAPYYNEVVSLIEKSYDTDDLNLTNFIARSLKNTCEYLDIEFKYQIYSKMDIIHEEPTHPGEWALNISKALGASSYINPPGGKDIFRKEQFDQAGIKLEFLEAKLYEYNQGVDNFEPKLSIIDVMMFNSPIEIKNKLNDFKISS